MDATSLPVRVKSNLPFNRLNDIFVKFIFATENNKKFLIDLLNAVFKECPPPCVNGEITDVFYEDRELPSFHIYEKGSRLDIRAKTDQGQIIDIEVQCKLDKTILDRSLYYFSKVFGSQPIKGEPYDKLKPVIVISLLKENYFPNRPKEIYFSGRPEELYFPNCPKQIYFPNRPSEYVRSFSMHDDQTNELLENKKETLIFIEIKKCLKLGDKDKSRLTRWMNYLGNPSDRVIEELAAKDKIIAEVMEAEEVFRDDTKQMDDYALREMVDMEIDSAWAEGKAEGRAEGKAEGIAEGIAIGEARGEAKGAIKNTIAMAKRMIAAGLNRETIKEVTKLTDSQLAEIM